MGGKICMEELYGKVAGEQGLAFQQLFPDENGSQTAANRAQVSADGTEYRVNENRKGCLVYTGDSCLKFLCAYSFKTLFKISMHATA